RFEVAIRSYVSDNITSTFTEQKFINNMDKISDTLNGLPNFMPIYSMKYKSKAKSMANSSTYALLINAKKSYDAKEVIDGDVNSLGKIIDLLVLLYNPLFSSLGSKFDSLEQFIELLNNYHEVRNNLAHIASAKIHYYLSEKVINLI